MVGVIQGDTRSSDYRSYMSGPIEGVKGSPVI